MRARHLAFFMVSVVVWGAGAALSAAGEEESLPPVDTDEASKRAAAEAGKGETPPVQRVREVIVSASRVEEPGFDAPYAVNVVPANTIRDNAYRTPTDAVRDIPGVLPQKTSLGQGSPYIRGFTGYHTLMLVDGIRLNNSVFRSGPNQYWNTIDPLSLSRIEVVKGPGSVMYGSDAVGGVLGAFTKGPAEYGDGFLYGGLLAYRWSSAERSNVEHGELWATWEHKLGLYLGGSLKDFGDLRGGRLVGRQFDTGYDEWDGDFKAEYFLNPNTRLVLGHQSVRQFDVPRTHKTVFGTTWDGLTAGTDRLMNLTQERDLTYIQLHAENLKDWVDAVHLSLSWQQQNESQDRVTSKKVFSRQGFEVGTLGASAQLESPTPIGRLVYGVDVYHDNVGSFSTTSPIQGPVGDDASYLLAGAFVEDRIPVGEQLELALGARYEHARARADSVLDPATKGIMQVRGDWDSVVGSARAVYHVDPKGHWNLFGGVSQGFRAPNLSDLTRFDLARTKEIETPSPNLEPERFLGYEIGVKGEYENLAAQASYFCTAIDHLIVRQPTGQIISGNNEVTKRNAGSGFVQGIELAGSWRFHPQFTAFGNVTWMAGKIQDYPTSASKLQWEPLSRVMPPTGELGVRWNPPNKKLWAEVVGNFAARQDKLSADDARDTSRIPPGGTPGYAVLSLRAGYQITRNIDLTAAIENVTNVDYRIHGSGINEPGRNFLFGLNVRF